MFRRLTYFLTLVKIISKHFNLLQTGIKSNVELIQFLRRYLSVQMINVSII